MVANETLGWPKARWRSARLLAYSSWRSTSSNVSTRRQWFTRVRLLGSYLAALVVRLSVTLTTPALDRRSLRRFGVSPCRATPEGQPPSLMQPASVRFDRFYLDTSFCFSVTHAPRPFFN